MVYSLPAVPSVVPFRKILTAIYHQGHNNPDARYRSWNWQVLLRRKLTAKRKSGGLTRTKFPYRRLPSDEVSRFCYTEYYERATSVGSLGGTDHRFSSSKTR